MWERHESIITKDGWILCAKCGHKLAKVVGNTKLPTTTQTERIGSMLEFKCSSCKALNTYNGGGEL